MACTVDPPMDWQSGMFTDTGSPRPLNTEDHRAFTERIAQLSLKESLEGETNSESPLSETSDKEFPTLDNLNLDSKPDTTLVESTATNCDDCDAKRCTEKDLQERHVSSDAEDIDKLNTKSSYRLVRRTVSECSPDVRCTIGILKYPRGWHRRTVSESGCDTLVSCEEIELDCGSAAESTHELVSCCETDSHDDRPKKSVRFNEHVWKTTFRASSSILGRKKKNQRRAMKRHNSADCRSQSPSKGTKQGTVVDSPDDGEPKQTSVKQRQDSGYDSEESFKDGKEEKPRVEQKWSEVKSKRNRRRVKLMETLDNESHLEYALSN